MAVETPDARALERQLRQLEKKLVAVHDARWEPATADPRPTLTKRRGAAGPAPYDKFMGAAHTKRATVEHMTKEQREKKRDTLLRKYQPLLDEELRKIDSHFPRSGSQRAKENLIRVRTQVFARRINLEIEKTGHEFGRMTMDEMAAAISGNDEQKETKKEVGGEDTADNKTVIKHRDAKQQFHSTWAPTVRPT